MAVSHCRAGNGLVVVGLGPVEQQVLAREIRGDLLHHLIALVKVRRAAHDHGHADGLEDRADRIGGVLRRAVSLVGMASVKANGDCLRAKLFNAEARHCGRIGELVPK